MSARRFEGKNVIVTGAGQGIGRAIAERFAAEGAELLLMGRRREPLDRAVHEIEGVGGRALAHPADVSDPEQVRGAIGAAMARWGRVDVLVNNAGLAEDAPFLEIEVKSWDHRVLGTNLRGAFLMAQAVAREQVSNGGSIIHIASIDASGGDDST